MAFGFVRRSRYEELQRERDKLAGQVEVLTRKVENFSVEVANLNKKREEARQRILGLQMEVGDLHTQTDELAETIENLNKEREVFQKAIRRLSRVARKRLRKNKRTSPNLSI